MTHSRERVKISSAQNLNLVTILLPEETYLSKGITRMGKGRRSLGLVNPKNIHSTRISTDEASKKIVNSSKNQSKFQIL
jgi:hypothetical protein